jgi:hypothetical protein
MLRYKDVFLEEAPNIVLHGQSSVYQPESRSDVTSGEYYNYSTSPPNRLDGLVESISSNLQSSSNLKPPQCDLETCEKTSAKQFTYIHWIHEFG